MEWVKTTAKTLPEAIDLALDNLGVDEAEAEIEIIEEPRPALFGLRTKGVARVKARVKPKPIRPKQTRERKGNKRRGDGGGRSSNRSRSNKRDGSGRDGSSDRNRSRRSDADRSRGEGKSKDRNRGGNSDDSRPKDGGGRDGAKKDKQSKAKSRKHDNSGGDTATKNDNRSGAAAAAAGTAAVADAGRDRGTSDGGRNRSDGGRNERDQSGQRSKKPAKTEETASVDEVANHLQDFLQGLTDAFGLDGDVIIDDSEDNTLIATVEGQHGLMVGPKGRTLDAIQELARISTQRSAPSDIRIKVDVGGYRAKRSAALSDFASKAADRAVDNGAEVALDPMTPADRKIVHDALNGDRRVETRSVGTEPYRKILIIPVDTRSGSAEDE